MSISDEVLFHYERARDLYDEERFREALSHIQAALELDPEHALSRILMGDLYTFANEDLGLEPKLAFEEALTCYSRVIAAEPQYAEAWDGAALVLLYLGRPAEALLHAQEGLRVLPLRIGDCLENAEVYANVEVALYDRVVRAHLDLGNRNEAREALYEGLRLHPSDSYLSKLIDDLLPC